MASSRRSACGLRDDDRHHLVVGRHRLEQCRRFNQEQTGHRKGSGEPAVGIVQAPQAHRDWASRRFARMMNWEYEGFFRIGMHHRHERGLEQHVKARQPEERADQRQHAVDRVLLRDDGQRSSVAVAVGDEVLYGRYSGNDVEVAGKEVKIMRESDILAKVVK